PQSAVLIERGDALSRRHELRAALSGRRFHELDDRLLRRAVVPGGERISLGADLGAPDKHGYRAQHDRQQVSGLPLHEVLLRMIKTRAERGALSAKTPAHSIRRPPNRWRGRSGS